MKVISVLIISLALFGCNKGDKNSPVNGAGNATRPAEEKGMVFEKKRIKFTQDDLDATKKAKQDALKKNK